MVEPIKDISNALFGWLAYQLCCYLLWLAPRTIVIANVDLVQNKDTVFLVNTSAKTSRAILVRVHIDTSGELYSTSAPTV